LRTTIAPRPASGTSKGTSTLNGARAGPLPPAVVGTVAMGRLKPPKRTSTITLASYRFRACPETRAGEVSSCARSGVSTRMLGE
jgi:hypothetical protein